MRRSGSHTTHGTHPECSGNAPPTAARAHAWRGGYPYHAHFDLAAGSTHPPPIHMLIVRPGAPPHLHRPHRAGSTTCCSLPRRSALRGSEFSLPCSRPGDHSTTPGTNYNARHLTPGTITTPGNNVRHHHNARHHLRPAHRHHNNYPDRHILGDFDGYFFCGNHSTSTILQPTATTSMLLPHRTSSTTCSPVAATASSPTTTTTE